MNKEDKEWLQKCLDDPDRYKIYVDNKFIGLGTIENNILKRDLVI